VATLRPDPISGIDIYYVHGDHLGTPKVITRPSDNAIVWRWDQDPFGMAVPNQNPSSLGTFVYNLRFRGQYYDQELGLNYNYFRHYDPNVGRYVESDPSGLAAGVNTYAYALANPVALNDSFGLAPGDSFPSVEAAAVDALNYISVNLDCAKSEYGGVVYREWSLFGPPTYTYDEPTDLGPTGGIMPPLPLSDSFGVDQSLRSVRRYSEYPIASDLGCLHTTTPEIMIRKPADISSQTQLGSRAESTVMSMLEAIQSAASTR
jgi:RHS repeat-associated protein